MVGRRPSQHIVATVRDGLLLVPDDSGVPSALVVGSEAWYAWVENATTFAFVSAEGHYTARKERFRRGGWYWKAYRSSGGKLYRSYLGKSETLNLARLVNAATHLNGLAGPRSAVSERPQALESRSGPEEAKQTHARGAGRKHNDNTVLLTAKLRIPSLPTSLVSRPRLIDWLDHAAEHPVALVHGTAGSGKTTLVTDWVVSRQRGGAKVAWVQLDKTDNDPARFWRHVLTALERIWPGLGVSGLALLDHGESASSQAVPTDELVAVLLDELGKLDQAIWLVLDDYHLVTSQVIHDAMATVAGYLPPTGRLVIVSREDLPFSDARLRAYERLVELMPGELRFTDPEAYAYFAARTGVHLDEADVLTLNSATEGWIAGLQLAALALERMPRGEQEVFVRAFTQGESPELVDFLVEEVLARQEASVREFLLHTAILDQLCGPLCDALMGTHNSQSLLERLVREHVFLIALDTTGQWYRYHHLFTEVMRRRLAREHLDQLPTLYARAAQWYATQGEFTEAVPYALASTDFTLAANMMEQAAPTLQRWGETATLLGWLTALPDAIVRERPHLCLILAHSLLMADQVAQAQVTLDAAERALASDDAHRRLPRDRSAELGAHLLNLRSDLLMVAGDYQGALEIAKRVYTIQDNIGTWRAVLLGSVGALYGMLGNTSEGLRAYREAEQVSRDVGDIPSLLESLFGQGSTLGAQGQLREAVAVYRLAVDVAEAQPGGPPPVAGASYWNLSRVLYEWNEREVAWSYLRKSIQLDGRYGDLGLLARCYLVQGRLYLAQGDTEGVGETLRQLQELAGLPRARPTTARIAAAMVARLSLAQGNIERAEEWAHQSGLATTDQPAYRMEFGHMTLLRLRLAQERYDEALSFASRLLEDAEATGRIDKMIELCLLRALALAACDVREKAIDSLARSLTLAEHGGYMRIFVDEGQRFAALLPSLMRTMADNDVSSPSHYYLQRIYQAANRRIPAQNNEPALVSDQVSRGLLSERELEILRRVDAGLSDAEIASELVVELSTVKWHLRNIYQKLGVHRRTQALAVGRSLELL